MYGMARLQAKSCRIFHPCMVKFRIWCPANFIAQYMSIVVTTTWQHLSAREVWIVASVAEQGRKKQEIANARKQKELHQDLPWSSATLSFAFITSNSSLLKWFWMLFALSLPLCYFLAPPQLEQVNNLVHCMGTTMHKCMLWHIVTMYLIGAEDINEVEHLNIQRACA